MNNKNLVPSVDYIPVARQCLLPGDREALHEVVESGKYAEGIRCQEFVRSLREYFHCGQPFLTNSGSSALLAALTAAREHSIGKYVLTSALNFPTTVSAIYQAGFQPWYLDCSPETMQVDLEELADCCIESDVAGIVLAHTLGFPFDASYVRDLLIPYGSDKFFLEDNCDAWGAELYDPISQRWEKTGSFGDMAALSGYPAHHISMGGEGGVVISNRGKYLKAIRSIINWGRDCVCEPGKDNACGNRFGMEEFGIPSGYDHKYIFRRLGYNLKATEFQGALGNQQLKHLPDFVRLRRENYQQITNKLSALPWIHILPQPYLPGSSPFGVPLLVENARDVISYLEEHKIGTRRIFGGNLLRQPAFRSLPCRKAGRYPGADELMENAFWIGCWPGWNEVLTDYVYFILKQYEEKAPS